MKYYKYLQIILILIPIIILGILFYKDFNPQGYLKVSYDFCHPTAFISEFSPHGRVLDVEKIKSATNDYCQQKMVIDPVYFDVRLPQNFSSATLKLWYQKSANIPLKIGPAINLNNWQWQLKDINYLGSSAGWQSGYADYNLSQLKLDNNRLRFLVSSPGLDVSHTEVVFKKMEIEFTKEPAKNWSDIFVRLKEFILFSKLKFLTKK
jgi:hypothetical protein